MVAQKKVYESAQAVFVESRNVGIVVWRGAPAVADVRAWHRFAYELGERHGACACFDIVVNGTPRFSDDVRRAAEDLAGDPRVFPLGFAHVLLLPGLAGAAVRAFIGTVLIVTRPPTPAKVVGDLASGIEWLLPKLGPEWTAATLRAECDAAIALARSAPPA